MLRPAIIGSIAVSILLATPGMSAAKPSAALCLKISGKAAAKCLKKYVGAVDKCRKKEGTACEEALRAEGGVLDPKFSEPGEPLIQERKAAPPTGKGGNVSEITEKFLRRASKELTP